MVEAVSSPFAAEKGTLVKAIVFLCVFCSMGKFNTFIVGDKSAGFDLAQLVVFLCYFSAWGYMLLNMEHFFLGRRITAHPLMFYLGYCAVSVLWSGMKAIVFYKTAFYLIAAGFGYFMARRFSLEEITRILFSAFLWGVLLSVAFFVVFPHAAMHQQAWLQGCLQGIMGHKNHLGRVCVFLLGFALLRWDADRKKSLLGCLAAVAVCIFTNSMTSLLVMVYTLLLFVMLRKTSVRTTLQVHAGAALALLVLPVSVGGVLELVGRDATLTGRTYVWEACYRAFWDNPFVGKGFSTFWSREYGYLSPLLYSEKWMMLDSHNGFIDLLLDLGSVGFALFAWSCLLVFRNAVRAGGDCGGWMIVFLFLPLLVRNLAESTLNKPTNFEWILFCYLYYASRALAARGDEVRTRQGQDPQETEQTAIRTSQGAPAAARAVPRWDRGD